ncbi:MAG: hypothetical protein E7165_01185 [Firmicutes bacterium]|nr:hypothetical protein [Bacillota bacterium]
MDKLKIGLPRGLFYYQNEYMWKYFFEMLDCDLVVSPKTNKEIIGLGEKYSIDEMCLSMKTYLGHVASLVGLCDYILVPRIDNYGRMNQSCTNFLAAYDLVNNLFEGKLLNYNVNYENGEIEEKAYLCIGKILGKNKKQIKNAYQSALIKSHKQIKKQCINSLNKLKSSKTKILLVGHDYNFEDELIGKPIIEYLTSESCEVIKCYELPKEVTNKLSFQISKTLYWKNNRENIGAIPFLEQSVDGIILLSSFPCGPDSIVNELVIRRVKLPILNLVVDDLSSFSGFETRLESFLDIVKQKIMR